MRSPLAATWSVACLLAVLPTCSGVLRGADTPAASPADAERKAFAEVSELVDARRPDLPKARAAIEAFAVRFPGARGTPLLVDGYMDDVARLAPDRVRAEWEQFFAFPDAAIAERAKAKVRAIELLQRPLEFAFTAVDGRSVDLRAMRGKVVLLDFWATWCSNCLEEMPTVKRVYERFHGRGFEVIGIALENPRILPGDSAEVAEQKRSAARQKMLAVADRHGMTWSQHFDGRFWQDELAAKFAVTSLPTALLIGPDGKVVSTNATGRVLEAEVRRLLGD